MGLIMKINFPKFKNITSLFQKHIKPNSNRDRVLEKMYNQEMEDIDRFAKVAESMTSKTSK